MNFQKLNPLNWFKAKIDKADSAKTIPIDCNDILSPVASLPFDDYHPMFSLHRQMEQMFGRIFEAFNLPATRAEITPSNHNNWLKNRFIRSRLNIKDSKGSFQILLDVPEFDRAELTVEVIGNQLCINGQKQMYTEHSRGRYQKIGQSYGVFRRFISLPNDIDADDIEVSLSNGVLEINLPYREHAKRVAKKISIQ